MNNFSIFTEKNVNILKFIQYTEKYETLVFLVLID